VTTSGVSVVVPVHGNAATLEELHDRLAVALAPEPRVRLVFVDDASPDDSGCVLAGLARQDDRVVVIRNPVNVGQHRAVLAGLHAVTSEWAVVMDADLQDPPEAVPVLLERGRRDGANVVFGARRGRYESRMRTATGRLYRHALAASTGLPPDAGIFCALHQDVVGRLLDLHGPEPAIVAMIACTRPRVASVPIARETRADGSSTYTSAARARSAWRAFRWAAWARRNGLLEET
jgi:polyisoprenyl-phosphate glycosyltransferase